MGKSDMQFVSDSFRMLSDLFNYHPSISAKQFLARGFSERKLSLMADIILVVIEKKKRLAPLPSRRPTIHSPSVVRLIGTSEDAPPSPRLSPPIPLPPKPRHDSVDLIAALTDRLASLEASVRSVGDTVNARVTILEGRIRFLEQKLRNDDRDENRPPTTTSEGPQSKGLGLGFDIKDDEAVTAPPTFSDRYGSSSGESLREAFAVLAQVRKRRACGAASRD
jgi:hypothetical protein